MHEGDMQRVSKKPSSMAGLWPLIDPQASVLLHILKVVLVDVSALAHRKEALPILNIEAWPLVVGSQGSAIGT